MEDEITLIDIIRVLNKYKRLIIGLIIVSLISAFIYSKVSPKEYKATATILPLESSTGSLTSALGMLGGGGASPGASRIIAVMKSKTLAKSVIENLDLLKVIYKKQWDVLTASWKKEFKPSLENAAASLAGGIEVKNTKEGVLSISIAWDDPETAAKIANAYVDKLGDFINNRSLGVTFQSVDPAVPPDKPFKPKLKLNLLLAGVASLFVGVMLAFSVEYFKCLKRS